MSKKAIPKRTVSLPLAVGVKLVAMKSAIDTPVDTKTGMLRAKFTTAPVPSDGRRMSQQIMEMDGAAAPGEERRRMLDMLRKIRHEHAMHLDEERAKYGGIVADLSATTHTQNSMLRRSRAQQAELKKELRSQRLDGDGLMVTTLYSYI